MSQRSKIVIGVGDLLGCGYYRCAMPYKHLSKLGFEVILTNKLNVELNPQDVLVLQRQHHEGILALAKDFKARGGKLVFELDDYFHELPPNNPARASYPRGGQALKAMESFMELSDLLTVSTPPLGDNYKKWASNVHVCYNVIDPSDFKNVPKEPRVDGTIRLGWAGSATHLDDLQQVIKPVTEILKEFPQTRFVFVGQNYSNLFPLEMRKRIHYTGHTFPIHNGKALFYDAEGGNPVVKYYELLDKSDIDIAIAPLLNVAFNRSKSYIKLIEYGMSNISFVASDYGPYSQFIRSTKNNVGYLADSNSNWKRNLKTLIADEQLRKTVAKNNYDNVIENHSITLGVNQWINALSSIGVYPDGEPGSYTENIVKMH